MPRPVSRSAKRRQTDYFDVDEDGCDTNVASSPRAERPAPAAAPASAPITASDLATMMTPLQQSQADMFERLLTGVLDARARSPPSVPAPASAMSSPVPVSVGGNFAACHARYSGAPSDSLDGFIDAIEAYKECANVSETNALRGLSMLLTNDAATWWQGVKPTITTWSSALECLRSAFGDRRPPHRIYKQLFSTSQQANEKTELFVSRARALLARLPAGDLTEKVELDMLYGLLSRHIRSRVRREEIDSYATLLKAAREIEDSLDVDADAAVEPRRHITSKPPPPATSQRQRQPPTTSVFPRARPGTAAVTSTPPARTTLESGAAAPLQRAPRVITSDKKRYCVYCKSPGHVRDECRKLAARNRESSPSAPAPVINCFAP
ncbi:hypothetical protein ABMA28_005032 [Loxostege sticticalis]|uniref:Gag protein n=1 Tax=Loxostege sticticalis TaxID=481309 RepID=A0ABD0SP06_LOXSC